MVSNDSGTIELWNDYGHLVRKRRVHDAPNMLKRLHDGLSFVGSDGFGLTVWEPTTLRRTMRVKWTDVHVYGIAASPVAPIVAGRTDGLVNLFDIESQEHVASIPVQPGLPILDFSPDGQKIVVGQGAGLALFDINGQELDRISYMNDRVLSAKFKPTTGEMYVGLASGAIEQIELG